jgi:pimeloyl-ACP methyl ester carboxylesterase
MVTYIWRVGVGLLVVVWALVGGVGVALAQEVDAPHACEDGAQASGAVYRICLPGDWDGQSLVLYAHGYVSPLEPIGIPEDQVKPPGAPLSFDQLFNAQGIAFAMSSYRTNGLATPQAVADTLDVLRIFSEKYGEAEEVTVFGVSDGGLVAALLAERYPQVVRGAVALCGPIGDYRAQINYFGDFRALFDYFFPEIDIPNTPIDIAPEIMENYDAFYAETLRPAITNPANAERVDQLLATANVSFDPDDAAATRENSMERLLWYNIMGVNDGQIKLGGQPFDNVGRTYSGSNDDATLNASVIRYAADASALATMSADYETTGRLRVPLLNMHTDGDNLVPYLQAERYAEKVATAGAEEFYTHIAVTETYGHCNFSTIDLLNAFNVYQDMLAEIPPFDAPKTYLPIVAGQP